MSASHRAAASAAPPPPAARSIPAQLPQPLPVEGVHRRVRVQREARRLKHSGEFLFQGILCADGFQALVKAIDAGDRHEPNTQVAQLTQNLGRELRLS